MIDLVGKMVDAAGGSDALRNGATPRVRMSVQDKTIRTEAGNFLKHVRSLPNGKALVEVVEAFGAVAASYLRHKDSKNEQNAPPHQASRIEPLEEPHLEGKAREVYDDLLRYAIFIEDVRGKSRRGRVVPRLYLRRFLIPFFNLTFSRRDSLELDVSQLRMLLLEPNRFGEAARLRSESDAENADQLTLLK